MVQAKLLKIGCRKQIIKNNVVFRILCNRKVVHSGWVAASLMNAGLE